MSQTDDLGAPRGSKADIEHGGIFTPLYDENGLIPAIVSDAGTGEVLMFAWMNREALSRTLATRYAHFWSRSRGRLWQKGEDSGNRLRVAEALVDCDQDVILLKAVLEGAGVACHTGQRSCFYRRLALGPDAARPVPLEPAG